MKTIKGDLILTEDTTFNESIIVEGHIKGDYDLKVYGKIYCRNIYCRNINCLNIYCWNINCGNIVCCDKIKVKKGCKVICKFLIKDRFNLKVKEWKVEQSK